MPLTSSNGPVPAPAADGGAEGDVAGGGGEASIAQPASSAAAEPTDGACGCVDNSTEEDTCPICLEQFGPVSMFLECGHELCRLCYPKVLFLSLPLFLLSVCLTQLTTSAYPKVALSKECPLFALNSNPLCFALKGCPF